MKLDKWIQVHGRGECARIVRAANVSFATVRVALAGKLQRAKIAERISTATGGAVAAASMMDLTSSSKDPLPPT